MSDAYVPNFVLVPTQPDGYRSCGECRACCTTMGVEELEKPHHTRCRFQQDHPAQGCQIYGKHPGSCQVWSCGWMLWEPEWRDMLGFRLPDDWRPDKIGFVVDARPIFAENEEGKQALLLGVTARLNVLDHNIWQNENVLPELKRLSGMGVVMVVHKSTVYAAIWRGVLRVLTPEQQRELDREGLLELWPGVSVTHDPGRRW